MQKNKIIILDGDNLSHRAYHAMKNMRWQGKSVSAIWGFLNILAGMAGTYKPKKIYVCWDDGRHKERLKISPTYKYREPKIGFDSDDFKRQKEEIRRLMYELGIPQLLKEGREADDYIYALQRRVIKNTKKTKVIVGSGDKDFRPHITKRVFIYDDKKGLITPLNFKRLFDLNPEQYVDYLAMLGDKSDNIPGVPGYGEKRTLEFLKEWGSIKTFAITGIGHPHYDKIIEATGVSRSLIDLKWFHDFKIKEKITEADFYKGNRRPKRREEKYLERCAKFGIKKFATKAFLSNIP